MQLTQEQCTAANHNTGHARVIAVAGAGKTATLIHYLINRLQSIQDPRRILVLMYNRGVKETFEQKLQTLNLPHKPTIRTFHSLGLKLYQGLIEHGYLQRSNLNPLPSNTIDLQIKQLLQANKQENLPLLNNETLQEWVETTSNFIQIVKCNLLGPEITFAELGLPDDNRFLIQIFNQFEEWRKNNSAITYDDMLYDPAIILDSQPKSQDIFKDKLDDILVDEYQDINPVQHFLLKVISGTRARVIVIGDPDQTIYEFRGSSPSFINTTFAKDFAKPSKYSLSQTFRFGHQLALAANQLISNNRNRDAILTISSDTTPNTKIYLAETDNHGHKIASAIQTLNNNGASYSGMAVLCRLWSYARPVELALMSKAIPYYIEGEQSILQCWEIRPLMHILNILSGDFYALTPQKKSEYLFDILSIPSPKIAHSILHDIARAWTQGLDGKPLYEILEKVIPKDLSHFQKKSLKYIVRALKCLNGKSSTTTKIKKYAELLDYQQKLKDTALNPTKGLEHAGTVNAFLQFIQSFALDTASDILGQLSAMQNSRFATTQDAVTITTIHRSKGREWPAIFIPDVTEGHLPYIGNSGENFDFDTLESERRLMYVAITRAQKQLFLTTSKKLQKTTNKKELVDQAEPSRFIQEMSLDSCKQVSDAIFESRATVDCSMESKDIVQRYLKALNLSIELECEPKKNSSPSHLECNASQTEWAVGDKIKHNILGLGEVIKLENEKIVIRFDKAGTRTFVSHLAQAHLSLASC